MMIIGHRGAKALEPENTLRAIRRGMQCADYVEIDVRVSSDGKLVVIHDPTLERTTNGTGRVKDHTLAELLELDAGKGEKIPTLAGVLSLVRGRSGLFVEIKEQGTEHLIAREVESCRPDRLLFVSFHEESIAVMGEKLPHAATGLIVSERHPASIETAKGLGASAILAKMSMLTASMVKEAHENDLFLISWTANSVAGYRTADNMGVDGIATDDPCGARDYYSQVA